MKEKVIEIDGRKFVGKEPAGYALDVYITKYLDEKMNIPPEKLPEANVELIAMVFGLDPEEVKALPNSVYRPLLVAAGEMVGFQGKKGR